MNASLVMQSNSYERIAINLAEIIYDLDCDQENVLRELLTQAYHEAYKRAAGQIEVSTERAAG